MCKYITQPEESIFVAYMYMVSETKQDKNLDVQNSTFLLMTSQVQ